ncbi:MAG: hypothetical protein HW390_456 [Candidatus Brocadiaceae bacterium]|nr:hypothetical protein [Candidatus Brocadiaceae bacterium]
MKSNGLLNATGVIGIIIMTSRDACPTMYVTSLNVADGLCWVLLQSTQCGQAYGKPKGSPYGTF